MFLRVGERDLYIDLAAEKPGGEVVAIELIAVEVKSFNSRSPVADLQQALGQFGMYRSILDDQQPERVLYLAVPFGVYGGILSDAVGSADGGAVRGETACVPLDRPEGVAMDKLTRYREIVPRELQGYAD